MGGRVPRNCDWSGGLFAGRVGYLEVTFPAPHWPETKRRETPSLWFWRVGIWRKRSLPGGKKATENGHKIQGVFRSAKLDLFWFSKLRCFPDDLCRDLCEIWTWHTKVNRGRNTTSWQNDLAEKKGSINHNLLNARLEKSWQFAGLVKIVVEPSNQSVFRRC